MPAIPKTFLDSIFLQAGREYPRECCGMILGIVGKNNFSRTRAFKNAQDEYHAKDPENFPRTSSTAYFMDPGELLLLQKELRESEEEIRVIYHSHIDAPAHFSAEDKRMAVCDGSPLYPGVDYLVVSVMQGKVKEVCLYRWKDKGTGYFLIKK